MAWNLKLDIGNFGETKQRHQLHPVVELLLVPLYTELSAMLYCELCDEPSIYVMKFMPCTHVMCSDCFVQSIWRNRGDALECLRSTPALCWVCRAASPQVVIITWHNNNGVNVVPDN